MAIIDQITGYYGFTIVGSDNDTPDVNGDVKKCLIAIVYPLQVTDVDIEISNGVDDWAVKMGNGDIIPLSNPNVLFVNRDSAIVEFDLATGYPSNSPCTLVYHSNTASFNIKPRTTSRPFTVNSVSGQFAFTVDGYGGTPGGNGLVNRLIASIPYPQMINTVKFEITKDPSHWGARMGDGNIIPLRDPEVMATNIDNAVVKFTMDEYYPSNSPCVLVYRSKDASISIKPADDDTNFYPISDIIDVPSKGISGMTLDLNECHIMPFNASSQRIDWSVVNGPGEIIGKHYLFLKQGGTISIRATVENGSGEGTPFVKTFSIDVTTNVITIMGQPVADVIVYEGKINNKISVAARSLTEEVHYQWHLTRANSYDNSTVLSGENNPELKIPSALSKGDYYYFCEITSNGAAIVYSSLCHVNVEIECTGIDIMAPSKSMQLGENMQLSVQQYPDNSYLPTVVWSTNNSDMLEITSNGKITSKMLAGNVVVTAKTVDGKFTDTIEITINPHIPVTDISNIKTELGIGEDYKLSPAVEPPNASYKEVKWTLDSAGSTGAVLSNGFLRPTAEGVIKIHATIEKGFSLKSPYMKDFTIRVLNKSFVPVSDITMAVDTSKVYNVDEVVSLASIVTPLNASHTSVNYSVKSGPGVLNSNLLSFTGRGNVIIVCTIINGTKDGTNYTKEFSISCSGEESPKELVAPFVPVTDITIEFRHEDDNGDITVNEYYDPFKLENNPMSLPYSIKPTFATNQNIYVSVKSITSKQKPDDVANGKTDIIPDDFWNNTGWVNESTSLIEYDDTNNQISCDTNSLKVSTIYQVTLHFSINDGVSKGSAFEKDITIKIATESVPLFVPLVDFDINLPKPLRTYYPIFPMSLKFTPENASVRPDINLDTIHFEVEIPKDENTVGAVRYQPSNYDMYHTVDPLKIFEWNRETLYMYPYNPGLIKMKIIIENATVDDVENFNPFNPSKVYMAKNFEIPVLPPFIPVKSIKNIPLEIPASSVIQLSPEVSTDGGLNCYNPCWDEEVATNQDITWEIIDNNQGVSIDENGVITTGTTSDVTITLKATIKEGTQEYLEWYDKTNEAIDYEESFSIKIVSELAVSEDPIIILTLEDNTTVDVTSLCEMYWICSSASADSSITIGSNTFKKSDVVKVEFKEVITDAHKLTTLKNFCRNFTSLTEIVGDIPSTVTGDSCLENFLRGCTSFNQEINIPDTVNGKFALKYFMKDCTSFNSDIILPTELTGEGCLHGFLDGCTSFNKKFDIPSTVTGDSCLENFLRGCTSFNQEINIPSGVSGYACMRAFLRGCTSFNQSLTLPDDVGRYVENGFMTGRQMCNMLEGADAMCSTITVPSETGKNAQISERTFSSYNLSSSNMLYGILLDGDGAESMLKRITNTYEPDENGFYAYAPYVHIRNLD